MGLTVRSSRCAAISMIVFGFFFLVGAAAYISFSLLFGHYVLFSRLSSIGSSGSTDWLLTLSWYLGYPSLLAIITMITGCIGVCASGRRTRPDTCQTVTLSIFALMVAALSGYTIFDFSVIVSVTDRMVQIDTTKYHDCLSLCRILYVTVEGSLLGLAILFFLLSSWAIICCLASFCCHTEVQPEHVAAREQIGGGQQGVMMQGAVMVPMMRTDTMPVVAPPNPAVVQPVYGMPVSQGMHVVPVSQTPQQPLVPVSQAPQQPLFPVGQAPQQPVVPVSQAPQQPVVPVGQAPQQLVVPVSQATQQSVVPVSQAPQQPVVPVSQPPQQQ